MNEINNKYNSDLIRMLFLIRKAKPYWQNINTTDNISDTKLRDLLSLEIAEFYSLKNDDNFDLTAIFKHIYKQYNM
jgi:hypothetical protein